MIYISLPVPGLRCALFMICSHQATFLKSVTAAPDHIQAGYQSKKNFHSWSKVILKPPSSLAKSFPASPVVAEWEHRRMRRYPPPRDRLRDYLHLQAAFATDQAPRHTFDRPLDISEQIQRKKFVDDW